MKSFKRTILAGFFLCLTGVIGILQAQPLRDLADNAHLLFGSYDTGLDWDNRLFPIWLGPPEYAATLAGEFNTMVINVSMPSIQNHQGVFDFEYPDSAIAFASRNSMKVIGQHLVWGAGHPNDFWFDDPAQGPSDPDTIRAILKNHVQTVARQLAGKIYAYSVVNEELVFGTTEWDTSSWRGHIGDSFIDSVFVWVSQADPEAKLYYNETEAEAMGDDLIGQRSDSVFAMVSRLVETGIPIDGVGLQLHTSLGSAPNAGPRDLAGLQNNISRYATLGLDVYFTEIDVSISHGTGSLNDRLAEQGKVYSELLRICLSNENCKLFNVWGVADQYSWIFYEFPSANIPDYPEESPLLFDTLFVQKPAYDSLAAVFSNKVVGVSGDAFHVSPAEFILEQNYPNPFNPETIIRYQLPHDSHVTLRIFNLLGQEVETLVDKSMLSGEHQAIWNGMDKSGLDAATGMYLVQISASSFVQTQKMLLIR